MRQVPNLNWIRSFEASARLQSFTEAAKELHMTQSGVSQHVRALELYLRQPLFQRLPRGVQLTDAGGAYLHVIRDSFEILAGGTHDIFGVDEAEGLTLRVNVAFATQWLGEKLGEFQKLRPGISLRLLAAVHGQDTVWDGIDFEIRYGTCQFPGLDAEALMHDRLSPVCDRVTAERLHSPQDLLEEHLIHVIGNSHGWTEWFSAAGVRHTMERSLTQTDTSAIALELAERSVGVALGHASLVAAKLARGTLVQPFDLAIDTDGVFFLVSPSGRKLRPQAKQFRDWILREVGRADGAPAAKAAGLGP